jgi:hypothetical protein
MGRRNVSNVPAQALILMNDPLVVQLSSDWAKRADTAVPQSNTHFLESRIQWMYMTAFARSASDREIETARSFLEQYSRNHGLSIGDIALWSDFAHALVNKKEFVFER